MIHSSVYLDLEKLRKEGVFKMKKIIVIHYLFFFLFTNSVHAVGGAGDITYDPTVDAQLIEIFKEIMV